MYLHCLSKLNVYFPPRKFFKTVIYFGFSASECISRLVHSVQFVQWGHAVHNVQFEQWGHGEHVD
jgi:hypothetical protein